jgi:hypothetical protein
MLTFASYNEKSPLIKLNMKAPFTLLATLCIGLTSMAQSIDYDARTITWQDLTPSKTKVENNTLINSNEQLPLGHTYIATERNPNSEASELSSFRVLNFSREASRAGGPCTTSADTWTDLNGAGGAPCFDGVSCATTDAGWTAFGAYGSESYPLDNVQAGADYIFDMCTGVGAGSWIPEIVILAADGTTIDANNVGSSTSGATHGGQCSLSWTASQSGTYTIIVNELGTSLGDAPAQVDCNTSLQVDNGNPTVSCGVNPGTCLPCAIAGTLTSATSQTICPGDSATINVTGTSSGTFEFGFDDSQGGTGGMAGGFNLTGISGSEFPYNFDSDLNGVLSANALDPLSGVWVVTVYAFDPTGVVCDSTVATTIEFAASCGGDPCIAAENTYDNLNTAGGAPCFDGTQCAVTNPDFTTAGFGIWGSEAYTLDNVQAGADYVFDMCSGFGAGAWVPEITILTADGVTIDAENTASSTSGLNHGQQCSLSWTATQSGQYTIIINEMGTAQGDAPSQINCLTTLQVDNGNPTVACGPNPATCVDCSIAGTLTSALSQNVCPGDTGVIALNGSESSPGNYSIGFSDIAGGTGGLAGGFTIIDVAGVDFPWGFDNDLNGILSANMLDPLDGAWIVTAYATDATGINCDSTVTTEVNFLDAADPLCNITTDISTTSISNLSVYPNPSAGNFTIEISGVETVGQISILDLNGRSVYEEPVVIGKNFRKTINPELASGSYIMRITTEGDIITSKLTVN